MNERHLHVMHHSGSSFDEDVVGIVLRSQQTRRIQTIEQCSGHFHDQRDTDPPTMGGSRGQHFSHRLHLLGLRLQPS